MCLILSCVCMFEAYYGESVIPISGGLVSAIQVTSLGNGTMMAATCHTQSGILIKLKSRHNCV